MIIPPRYLENDYGKILCNEVPFGLRCMRGTDLVGEKQKEKNKKEEPRLCDRSDDVETNGIGKNITSH